MMKLKKFKKLTPAQRRDFVAYCRIMRGIKVGQVEPLTTPEEASCLAHWFVLWDTHGVRAAYRNQALCWRLVQAKEQLNLTINLWIEDLLGPHCIVSAREIRAWCEELPGWVWKSFVNNFRKQLKDGWCPTFANPLLLEAEIS